ncbi:unnamed protein product [Rodentolepis nana]|uniref:Corticotropin-releasing factor domain-containing protein n=1 Tax=Rodentolepis nana TaxID=102285 RepID=A0A0R3TTI4_RODNA|nr:unnamed protein product [Rodentolepis nana]
MNKRHTLVVVFLAFLFAFVSPGIVSRPMGEKHPNPPEIAQVHNPLVGKRSLESMVANQIFKQALRSALPGSGRRRGRGRRSSRRQWNGNMVRYG